MSERVTCGQVVGLALVLLIVVGVAALTSAAMPASEKPGSVPNDTGLDSLSGSHQDCPDLITPDTVGPAQFERLHMADRLQSNQVVRTEAHGYIVCSLGDMPPILQELPDLTPARALGLLLLYADSYFIFDSESGALAITYLTWEAESPEPAPSPTPRDLGAMMGHGTDTVTICMDLETPIVEVGDANPEQWSILDIVGGRCWASLASQVCFDCGADRAWRVLVPIAANREAGSGQAEPPMSDAVCIDAGTAIELSDSGSVARSAEGLDTEQCGLSFGHGGLCWYCSPHRDEAAPSPPPLAAEGGATPTRPEGVELACSDLMTPETIGQEEWERYDVAEKLRSHRFSRSMCSDSECIICSADRMIDEAHVDGDKLYYRFDVGSGELVMKRIHWREDLPEQLPSPLISQQEAEGMVDDVVEHSRLAFLPPDSFSCEPGKLDYQSPNWLVYGTTGGEISVYMVTVIDAVTGEERCYFCPC